MSSSPEGEWEVIREGSPQAYCGECGADLCEHARSTSETLPAEVARLEAALNEAADKLQSYAVWVTEPDRHAKMLRAARRAREATDALP